jgi:hypothetical protein
MRLVPLKNIVIEGGDIPIKYPRAILDAVGPAKKRKRKNRKNLKKRGSKK